MKSESSVSLSSTSASRIRHSLPILLDFLIVEASELSIAAERAGTSRKFSLTFHVEKGPAFLEAMSLLGQISEELSEGTSTEPQSFTAQE